MSGAGWSDVLAAADANPGTPSLSNQDSNNSTSIMACALVYARTGEQKYLEKVLPALRAVATGTLEKGSRALAVGRELIGYVLAADIVQLKTIAPTLDEQFRAKLRYLLTYKTSQAGSLIDCSLNRPNNWGGHSIASWIAAALYIGDTAGVEQAATVLRGWMGDRDAYAGFDYGELWWQADPAHPVGVLSVGATIEGHDVSGGQPEELRRAGGFQWPPAYTVYAWEGLQGRVAAAEMLHRAGYDAWNWCDKALLRAVQFNFAAGWPAEGDDKWQIPVINRAYGVNLPGDGVGRGKNVGWTRWTHQ